MCDCMCDCNSSLHDSRILKLESKNKKMKNVILVLCQALGMSK